MSTNNPGIDYGMGITNVDLETGIRYGVIHHSAVGSCWYDSSGTEYPDPCCTRCGAELVEFDDEKHSEYEPDGSHTSQEQACENCEVYLDSESFMYFEAIGFYVKDDEIHAYQGSDDCDIFISKSKYYTKAQFCSPCAPGAGYLKNYCPDGPKTYCFGPDWFEDGKCPYPVWEVGTDKLVYGEHLL